MKNKMEKADLGMIRKCKYGKIFLAFVILLLLCGLTACGKEEIEPGIPLHELTVHYEVEGSLKAVATIEDGSTYILTESPGGCRIYRFDGQGEHTDTYPLDGYCNIDSIVVEEDGETIYFAGQNLGPMALYAFHPATGQCDELCNFWFDIAQAKKIVLLGDKMFIMGQERVGSYAVHGDDQGYDFSMGETILCCSMEDGEYSALEFKYPVNIAPSGKGTLIIFAYFPEEGYCLVEYDPEDASVSPKAKLDECRFREFAVCNDGKSLLYGCTWSSRGLVMADFDNIDFEVELYDDSSTRPSNAQVWYGDGKVYLQDSDSGQLVSFPLNAVQKKNKVVSLVSPPALSNIVPYGCGYRLERLEEDWDKIALKILSQDRDYDLCIGSSAYSGSITIRDSGVFYPLNELPGIEEYLDRCFPYVREAATTQSGEIWMLPFSVSTYAMFVQGQRAEQRGLNLHDHMPLSEFAQMVGGLSEKDEGLFYARQRDICEEFLNQYFWHNQRIEEKAFLESMENLRVLYHSGTLLKPEGNVNEDIVACRILPLGMLGRSPSRDAMTLQREGVAVYGIPKGESTDKNNITLYYFVVNGKSKYRKEALNYLADLIAYLMGQDDLWIFQGISEEAGSVEEQARGLFADGEVSFAVDEDVYRKDYEEVLKSDQPLEQYVQELERRLLLYWEE